jgi:bifunctional DNA-binding transcriptional regulator/antitoxin component of YhaV-PrlF toxin-antitoxin module
MQPRRLAKPVAMTAGGRLTLPAEARKDLGIYGEAQFQVEVIPGGLILREAVTVPVDDAWAYTPEVRDLVRRSREDAAKGRVVQLSMAELEKLIEDAE